MAKFSTHRISELLEHGDTAPTKYEKGKALEDLICYVFQKVPGIAIAKRNALNAFQTEEIDVAFWNNRQRNGLDFLPNIILVECKNWSQPVGSLEVAYFAQRLLYRGRDFGVLFAANGVTGAGEELTRAHYEIAMALRDGRSIVVVTRSEIESISDTSQLVVLLKEKLCELAVSGTVFA